MILKSVIIAVLIIMQGCLFPVPRDPHSLIDSLNGYTVGGDIRSYDTQNLTTYKSRDALVFIEFGLDSCLVADMFSTDGTAYRIEVISFHTPRGALGLYAFFGQKDAEPLKLGYSGRRTGNAIQFVKGYYVVTVSSERGSLDGTVNLARAIAKRIEGGRIKPDIYESLPKTNLVGNTQLYFMGPQAFQTLFGSGLAAALNLEKARECVTGKYLIQRRNVQLIKIVFAGREESLDTVDSYLRTRTDRPVLHAVDPLRYHTVIEPDRSENYVAEYGDAFYLLLGASPDGKGQAFFEYILRGGM